MKTQKVVSYSMADFKLMLKRVLLFWLWLLPLSLTGPARAETPSGIPNPLRANRSWVADSANVLSPGDEAALNNLLSPLERRNGAEVAVVTVRNLGGQSVEEFANDLFQLWGIGKKTKDNGVLILAAIDDRKIRIEVGYGLEDTVTDGDAASIISRDVKPAFRSGNYGPGMIAATTAVVNLISPAPGPTSGPLNPSGGAGPRPPKYVPPSSASSNRPPVTLSPAPSSQNQNGGLTSILSGLLCCLLPITALGGLGVWGIFRATRPKKCPHCGTEMQKLSEVEDDQYLTPPQQFEERIGSVDYRVWRCPTCHRQEMDHRDKFLSSYSECPRCHHRTLYTSTRVLEEATYDYSGRELVTRQCQWQGCRHYDEDTRVIPRRERPSSSSAAAAGAGFAIGSSSSDWGSSSSDSSSSSSSSFDSGPSDFGGGSSGGGGASDSW